MRLIMEEARFAGGFVSGVAGTFIAWQFGAAVLTSGWTSAACSVALLAGAGAVASVRWLGDGVDPVMRDAAGRLRSTTELSAWRQSDRPRDWLRAIGMASVLDEEVEGVLRARLSGCLSYRTDSMEGTDLPVRPHGVTNLATALAALAVDTRNGSLRDDAKRLMRALAKLHEPTEEDERATMREEVMAQARRIAVHPEVSRAYSGIAARHATTETFMMGLLEGARRNGPLGPNEFRWLKEVDRGLWYALDNLGRRSFHVEGLAAMDHYAHEKASGGRLSAPQVGNAVYALSLIAVSMRHDHGKSEGSGGGAWEHEDVLGFDDEVDGTGELRP